MSLPFRQLNFDGSSPSTSSPLSMPNRPITTESALSEREESMPAVAALGMAEFTARQPSIDNVESSAPQIVSIMDYRPADQYDWTNHDLESLRRDREEAEQDAFATQQPVDGLSDSISTEAPVQAGMAEYFDDANQGIEYNEYNADSMGHDDCDENDMGSEIIGRRHLDASDIHDDNPDVEISADGHRTIHLRAGDVFHMV
ncbi:hypothetical protein LTR53_000640 [Teratosphaeriaceae sp. CCFEE 6253]|nr:hypothetical protein LTR53_000640 [Teratosphaeriaceae sp. CCFEE 6253]